MAGRVAELLARRVAREGPVAVSSGDVLRWSEAHRETAPRHWPDRTDHWVAPPLMVTSFIRPLEWMPDRPGPPADRGSGLHEQLKAELGYPLGIAVGYEMELHGLLGAGDRLDAVERIASVGEEENTRLGRGRRWVIENVCTLRGSGDLVAVERFSMLGYDPASAGPSSPAPHPDGPARHPGGDGVNQQEEGEPDRVEEWEVTAVTIAMGASANRVWVPAHLDRDVARAAGVRDQFLDTSSQVGILAGVAGRAAGPDSRPGRVALRMRRPICPGDVVRVEARVGPVTVDAIGVSWVPVAVSALVGDRLHSTVAASIAVAGPAGGPVDPWLLGADAWRP